MNYCARCLMHVELCTCREIEKETWTCPDCGTVHEIKPGLERICNYCESVKPIGRWDTKPDPISDIKNTINERPLKTEIDHKTLWDGLWSGINADPQQTYSKEELLSLKYFYERMMR